MKLAHPIPLRIPVLLLGVLLLLTAFLATGALSAHAAGVLHVPADYPTIQAAVDAASPGDKILVAARTYREQVLIDGKSDIELLGPGATLRGKKEGIGIKIVDSQHILVQGFTVEKYRTGIVLDNTNHSQIKNVETRFNDNRKDTVRGDPSALLNNGLDLIGSNHNLITNVFAHHNGHNGITLKGGSTQNTLQGNKSNDNGKNPDVLTRPAGCGIQLNRDGNHHNLIIDNEVIGNAFGILLSGPNAANPHAQGADHNTIQRNEVHGNARSGIDVRDGSNLNLITDNHALGNGGGGSPNVDLNDGGILDNTWIDNEGIANF